MRQTIAPLPPAPITSSHCASIPASAAEVERALDRLDVFGASVRALHALGLGDRVVIRAGGLTWLADATRGRIDVDCRIAVRSSGEDAATLCITTRCTPADDRARASLMDAWPIVSVLADDAAARAVARVRDYVEDDESEAATAADSRLARAA